jgi:WD repeat-containing protein 23
MWMFSWVRHSPSLEVFFIDTNGALCGRSSGHALDVESQLFPSLPLLLKYFTIHLGVADGRLVLRHRRLLTQPYPNAYSHPLPRFRYHSNTGRLSVEFENDPEFAGGTAWRAKTFYLTALSRPRPRTLLDDATDVLASAFRAPLSLFGGPPIPAHVAIAAGTDDTFNLRQEEVAEQDRGEDVEDDDDPAHDRAIRVIGLTPTEHRELSDKAWARRQWEVLPLRTAAARYSTLS